MTDILFGAVAFFFVVLAIGVLVFLWAVKPWERP